MEFLEDLAAIVVPVAFFASVGWIIKIITENITLRRAIDKGLACPEVASLFRREAAAASALKWAFVLIGIGLGLAIGLLAVPNDLQQEVSISLSVILAGVGLLLYYLLARKGPQPR